MFFDDGKRRIDLILAYEYEDTRTPGDVSQEETLRMEYRKTFEESLRAKGLELEIVDEKVGKILLEQEIARCLRYLNLIITMERWVANLYT